MEVSSAGSHSADRGSSRPPSARERVALVCATTAASLGGLGLLGWLSPWQRLASIVTASIPMAPSTALAILALGGTLVLMAGRRSPRLATAVALLVLAVSALDLALFVAGLPPVIDVLLVPAPAPFGGVLTGRMSPLTALGLVLAGLSLLFVGRAYRRRATDATGVVLALGLALLGLVVVLGYFFGAPLLYGGSVVPMALSTALAMLGLGLALVGLAPRDSAPLRPFSGASPRATLLRAFLPSVPILVCVELLFAQIRGPNPALQAALTALLSALAVTAIIWYAAHRTGLALEREQVERAQSQRTAARLAAIVESSETAIFAEDMEGTIIAWNVGAERLFGYSQAEALGRSAAAILLPGGEEQLAAIRSRISAGEPVAHRQEERLRKDGSTVPVSWYESPLRDAAGRVIGVSVVATDVSARVRTEDALRQSEASFRELAEAIPQLVWIARTDGWNVYVNQRWVDYTGLTLEETQGRGWIQPFHPEDRQRAEEGWRLATATAGVYSLECRLRRADGAYRWWLVRGIPLQDAAGVVLKWFGTCTDIHDLILAEQRVAESEERFSKIFHSGLVAFSIAERTSGRMVDVNERWLELFGFERDEAIGRTVFELDLWVNSADRERLIAGSSAAGPDLHTEAAFRRKSGEVFHALIAVEPVTLTGISEPLIMVALIDVTERKQLESQLLQAQKMEAVGRLAGGVAHDFNNALAVVQGYTEILMDGADEGQRKNLKEILQAATRASSLIRKLLAFSRKQVVDPRTLDLNDLLSNLEKMLRPLIGEDVDLAILPGKGLGPVKVDPGELEQAVINLCVNSRQAMPDGGSLRIETANVEFGTGEHAAAIADQLESVAPGRYVMIAVSDTGCGIDEEILPRIFEPFFTTKETGVGTGLGLAMVYGSVQQAGGYLFAESEVGRGTTMRIYLPCADEPAATPGSGNSAVSPTGSETILLVEDEAAVRTLVLTVLSQAGYRVIEAASGQEAIAAAGRSAQGIDLVITDVVMPGMNGRALAASLVAARPELRVIFMSGYTDDILARHGVLEPGTFFLAKPFTTTALLRRVREALSAGR